MGTTRRLALGIGIALAGLSAASPVLAGERAVGRLLGDTWIKGGDPDPTCIRILDELDRAEGAGDAAGRAAAYRQLRTGGCPVQIPVEPPRSAEYGSYDGATFGVVCPRKRLPDGHCPTLGQAIDYASCTGFAAEMRKAIGAGDEAGEANAYRKARRLGCALVERKR
jgi:hypothetical protein